jgi:hypothetical protein
MEELPALEWPTDWDVQPTFLAETFIAAMNDRPSFSFAGAFGIDVEDVKENQVRPFANALDTEGGKEDVAATILTIGSLVARDVAQSLEAFLPETSEFLSSPDPNVTFPDVARLMAQRFGILLAWVDVAIKEKTEDDLDTIRMHEELWEADKRMLGMLATIVPIPEGFEVAGLLPDALLEAASPDFEGQADDIRDGMRNVRNGYRRLSGGIFARTLEAQRFGNDGEESSGIIVTDSSTDRIVDLYGGWVLFGWNEELTLLGVSEIEL